MRRLRTEYAALAGDIAETLGRFADPLFEPIAREISSIGSEVQVGRERIVCALRDPAAELPPDATRLQREFDQRKRELEIAERLRREFNGLSSDKLRDRALDASEEAVIEKCQTLKGWLGAAYGLGELRSQLMEGVETVGELGDKLARIREQLDILGDSEIVGEATGLLATLENAKSFESGVPDWSGEDDEAGQLLDLANRITELAIVARRRPAEDVDELFRSWKDTRLKRICSGWIERAGPLLEELRTDCREANKEANKLEPYPSSRHHRFYAAAESHKERYEDVRVRLTSAVEQSGSVISMHFDALRKGLLADIEPQLRERLPPWLPSDWTEEMRNAWPEDYGSEEQKLAMESFQDGYWRLKGRAVDMVLIRPEDDGLPPFLMDATEVTYGELLVAREAGAICTDRKCSRGIHLEAPLELADEKSLLFWISFDEARSFARRAYPRLQLDLPTSRQWDAAYRFEELPRYRPRYEELTNEDLKTYPVAKRPEWDRSSSGVWGLRSGLSEWVVEDDGKRALRGLSLYKPWSEKAFGQEFDGASEYFEDPKRHKSPEGSNPKRKVDAWGFRCVYNLDRVVYGFDRVAGK